MGLSNKLRILSKTVEILLVSELSSNSGADLADFSSVSTLLAAFIFIVCFCSLPMNNFAVSPQTTI